MKIAVLSDIHANLQALTHALAAIERMGVDALCCLGDVVGYGADPGPCLALIRERCDLVVRGNHDEAVATGDGLNSLPRHGRKAALAHRKQLSLEDRAWLAGLPLRMEAFGCTFVHSTPHRPGSWLRLEGFEAIRAQFSHFETDVCFVGHTHIPGVASNQLGVSALRRGPRFLINPGSIGQPRDGDPRLAFGVFDTGAFTYELHRLTYDAEAAADRVRAVGLSSSLAKSLLSGR